MKNLLLYLVLGYLSFCILLFIFQRSLIYFPQSVRQTVGETSIQFSHDQQVLNGWVINPGQPKAVIYYGGNAESIEYNIEFFKRTLPDWSTYLVPYRGYGLNSGTPRETSLLSDALFVYDEVRQKHSEICLFGRSLGSGVATYVAAQRPVEHLILVTPFDSLVNVAKDHYPLFPVAHLLVDQYQSINHADQISAPILVLVAENDQVIKPPRSEALVARFNQSALSSVLIKGADHNDIGFYPRYQSAIREFLSPP
jgi:uncharacterized protein